MDYNSPFSRNSLFEDRPLRRQYTTSPPSFSGFPFLRPDAVQSRTSSPKVFQIPVHFVGSESTRSASALKIQKIFRGFLVRKSVKKIKDVKVQVDGIEEKLLKSEVMEMIKKDQLERLKMNESLMALLFKLDSVRGVDLGVRDFRKSVARKAVALQEKIDAVATASAESENRSEGNEEESADHSSHHGGSGAETNLEILGAGNSGAFTDQSLKFESCAETDFEKLTENPSNSELPLDNPDSSADNLDEVEGVVTAHKTRGCTLDQISEPSVENCRAMKVEESYHGEGGMAETCTSKGVKEEGETKGEGLGFGDRDRELLAKMMEENAKMMNLMKQLSENNEKQTQVLNSLASRVEMLEKAFVCDMLRRKKKKNCQEKKACEN